MTDTVLCKDQTVAYVGNIVTSAKYDPPESIRMTTGIKDFPHRVIMRKNIVTVNGKSINYVAPKEMIQKVAGSNGAVYTVKTIGGTVTCDCPGFNFRKTCKHIAMVK